MSATSPIDPTGSASRTIDTFIRLLLLGGLLTWCLLILAPFSSILLWAVIMAVALHPFFVMLTRWLGGKKGLAATLLVLVGLAIVAVPGYFVGNSVVSTVQVVRPHIAAGDIDVPQLPADWYTGTGIRRTIADRWPKSDGGLGTFIKEHSEQVRAGAAFLLSALGGFLGDMLKFIAAIIVMGILLAFAKKGGEGVEKFLDRVMGARGPAMVDLATSTVRSVAKGILGVALIQTVMLALGLFIAGVPAAGVLAIAGLILAIVQIGVGPIAIGVIVYAWATMGTLPAVLLTIWLVLTTLVDNVLKPLLLGRGASVPTAVIFLGAIGGFLLSGIIGLFTGAVILSIGYRLLQGWMQPAEVMKAA